MNYLKQTANSMTNPPQTEPLNNRQVINNAGGYVFPVDDWTRLDRFLILGAEGGSYYVSERKLARENARAVERAIQTDGQRVVSRVVEISESGRAPKNDPALFILAMCAGSDNLQTRRAALAALPRVARIGTHLFHFADYVESFRGWGRSLRTSIAEWYTLKTPEQLQQQLVKYRARDGWSHKDLLRLSHPKGNAQQNAAFAWAVDKPFDKMSQLPLIEAFEATKALRGRALARSIRENNLTREMVPTEGLNDPDVWEALLENMPMTAMIRNLATMTRVGLLKPMSTTAGVISARLTDVTMLRRARVHPISVLLALKTYQAGRGDRGKNTWTPVQSIVNALDESFYLAFLNVEPTGKRFYLGVDVSGSMSSQISGTSLSAREGAAALSLVTARTEKQHVIRGFTAGAGRSRYYYGKATMADLHISPRQRLDDVIKVTKSLSFGGTDCALPMLNAFEEKLPVDVFMVLTDSETWAGSVHPVKALEQYRKKMGIPAKLIVVGMVSNGFSIADPNDGGMLDVVGFDSAVPEIVRDFVRAGA